MVRKILNDWHGLASLLLELLYDSEEDDDDDYPHHSWIDRVAVVVGRMRHEIDDPKDGSHPTHPREQYRDPFLVAAGRQILVVHWRCCSSFQTNPMEHHRRPAKAILRRADVRRERHAELINPPSLRIIESSKNFP